jgi:hypothetical protein
MISVPNILSQNLLLIPNPVKKNIQKAHITNLWKVKALRCTPVFPRVEVMIPQVIMNFLSRSTCNSIETIQIAKKGAHQIKNLPLKINSTS